MSIKLKEKLVSSISEALIEINQLLGYEYFKIENIDIISNRFLIMLPIIGKIIKEKKGVTLEDIEKENMNIQKGKKAVIRGIFHGEILKNFNGNSFEEKFKNFLYYDGIRYCQWIEKTEYDSYYKTLSTLTQKIYSNTDKVKFVNNLLIKKIYPTSQEITKIFSKEKFFKDLSVYDDSIIDLYIDIFKELASIIEDYLKLIYGIKYDYKTEDIVKLNKKKFHDIWKDLKNDNDYSLFTKPFPNTIFWNASKHNGITKKVNSKEIQFDANEGKEMILYSDFISLVRELYACTLVLLKINLMINFNNKIF